MKKNIITAFVLFILLIGCLYIVLMYEPSKSTASAPFDPLNATYTVENDQVTLIDGKADHIEIFGEIAKGDINNDGADDAVFFLRQTSDGTGAFFYVAAALNTTDGKLGTNAVFLGDRIAPQKITINDGIILASYADRAEDESMAMTPSVDKEKSLTIKNAVLQEVNMIEIPGINDVILLDTTEKQISNILLDSPLPNTTVNNPLLIVGKARGFWFFEASFPVFLIDSEGHILGEGVAQAQSDWMTNDFVPFESSMTFTTDPKITNDEGMLVLQKDNPSGLHENEEILRIPVIIGR